MNATITYLPLPPVEPVPSIDLTPPAHYTPAERSAWLAGVAAGQAERDAAHDAVVAGFLAATQAQVDRLSPRPALRVV